MKKSVMDQVHAVRKLAQPAQGAPLQAAGQEMPFGQRDKEEDRRQPDTEQRIPDGVAEEGVAIGKGKYDQEGSGACESLGVLSEPLDIVAEAGISAHRE